MRSCTLVVKDGGMSDCDSDCDSGMSIPGAAMLARAGQCRMTAQTAYVGFATGRGIIRRAIEDIFAAIEHDAAPQSKFLVRASYLQIYNEVCKPVSLYFVSRGFCNLFCNLRLAAWLAAASQRQLTMPVA